jgi:hypothetical protein
MFIQTMLEMNEAKVWETIHLIDYLIFDSSFSLRSRDYETELFFFFVMVLSKHLKNVSSGEESSDTESESESSNASSGSGSLSIHPKKTGNVDSSSSTQQESTSQQPRNLSNVNINQIVEMCFQMVLNGNIGQIPQVLEMENISPEQKVIIYDELQKKLGQLEQEEET